MYKCSVLPEVVAILGTILCYQTDELISKGWTRKQVKNIIKKNVCAFNQCSTVDKPTKIL